MNSRVDANFSVRDRATLLAPNATGSFESLQIVSDRRVRFNFLGQRGWELDLLKKAVFRLPLVGEPLGVVRPFGFSRRFALSRTRDRWNFASGPLWNKVHCLLNARVQAGLLMEISEKLAAIL
jgi:hypothetical protein